VNEYAEYIWGIRGRTDGWNVNDAYIKHQLLLYLIKLVAALCIYFISGTTELIFCYTKTKEFELITGGTVGDTHFLIGCKT
jgi:hypothetical protein